MPCYQVNLINVEFKIKNKQILLDVLKELNIEFLETTIGFNIYKRGFMESEINFITQTAKTNNANSLNKIKKRYAEKIIQQVAIKKKWLFKKIGEGKIQLNKY